MILSFSQYTGPCLPTSPPPQSQPRPAPRVSRLSSQDIAPAPAPASALLLVGGQAAGPVQHVELVPGAGAQCAALLPDPPVVKVGAVAELLGRRVVVCGGWAGPAPTESCHALLLGAGRWTGAGRLRTAR